MSDFVLFKDCKKILDTLIQSEPGATVNLDNLENDIPDLSFLIEYLEKYAYVKDMSSIATADAMITAKGRRYMETEKIRRWNFIKQSIFTPFVVTVLTLLISYFLF